jgi:molecular chaperone DnaK
MAFSLGVDIGTTYTAAALWRNQTVNTARLSVPSSAPLGNHSNAVPSVLFLRDDGTLLVGDAATRRAIAEPGRVAREFKRRMGDDVPIRLDGQSFHAHELAGHLLRWVVDTVSEREGERPGHVVLTHPAEWGEYRRGLLTAAAGTAGLDVDLQAGVGLLPEPIAAATWYAAQERVEPGALIGIYDLGGGTFDASVVRKTGTGFEVYGEPGGDDSIGGIDFDHALLRHVASAVGVELAGLADTDDPATASALAALLAAVVDAKEALSADVEAVVPVLLPGLTRQVTVRRGEFEALVRPRLLATVQLFAQIMARAGADPATLRAVLLVGGSSRIPLVSQLLRAELGIPVAVDAHPKYAVSLGAAIAAAPRVEPAAPVAGPPAAPVAGPPAVGRAAVVAPPVDVGRSGPIQPGQMGSDRPTSMAGGPHATTTVDADPAPDRAEPAVAAAVDLAGTGLTAPTDIPVSPPRPAGEKPVVTDRDEPVRIRTRDGEPTGARRRIVVLAFALLVVAAVVVATVVVATVAVRGRRSVAPDPGRTTLPAAAPTTAPPSVGTARLTGQLVADPPGPDTMRGVTVRPDGGLVAVGLSVDLHPRAWVRPAGQSWRSVPPPSPGTGVMADVAAGRGGQLVAVGWTRDAESVQHPAVWLSANGETWRQVAPAGDLTADGLTELTAIAPVTGGGYLAIGVDRKADSVDGDGAVFRSDNGQDWHRVAATGLDGSGPQEVHRIAQTSDGRFVAVGSALTGARRGPAVWTSTDGTQWQLTATAPPGSPTLWAVRPQPDGSVVACGSAGTVDQPTAGCWLQRGDGGWGPLDVAPDPGSAPPIYLYALAGAPDGLVAVGAGQGPSGVDAAAWTVRLQQR